MGTSFFQLVDAVTGVVLDHADNYQAAQCAAVRMIADGASVAIVWRPDLKFCALCDAVGDTHESFHGSEDVYCEACRTCFVSDNEADWQREETDALVELTNGCN